MSREALPIYLASRTRFVIEYSAMSNDEPLELRDFVSETIKQVIDGVVAAQKYAEDKGAVVNPSFGLRHQKERPVQSISFDVALTAAKGTKTQGGVGVLIGVLGLGSRGQSEKSNESVNRIQFAVPISLPVGRH